MRTDKDLIYTYCYTPSERRRLARADAGPGRRFPLRVGRARCSMHFSRATVEHYALMAIPGLKRRHIWISEPSPGCVRIEVIATIPDAFRLSGLLRDHAPMGIAFDVAVRHL